MVGNFSCPHMKHRKYLIVAAITICMSVVYLVYANRWMGNKSEVDQNFSSKRVVAASGTSFLPIPEPPPMASQAPSRAMDMIFNAGDDIRTLSRSSSAKDRFDAYILVKHCITKREIESRIQNTVQAERQPGYPELEQYKDACVGVAEKDISSRRENLAFALAGHIPGAAHEFFIDGFNGDSYAVVQRPDDPLVKQWQKQTISELKAAAEQGDTAAMLDLYQLYHSGGFGEKDQVQALTYFLARTTVMAQQGTPTPESFISKRELDYTPDQIAVAAAAAKVIYDKCCQTKQ